MNGFHPTKSQMPRHIGLIPDGSRRWAKMNGVSLQAGYQHAMNNLAALLETAVERRCESVSLYLSSAHNFKRTAEEVAAFCEAETEFCDRLFHGLADKLDLLVYVAGNTNNVPPYLQQALHRLQTRQETHQQRRLYLCVAYDPFEEIEIALQKRLPGQALSRFLSVPEPLDLVVRTGGAKVISNFLPLQCGFARLVFSDKLFNDFTSGDLASVLDAFDGDLRLYGE